MLLQLQRWRQTLFGQLAVRWALWTILAALTGSAASFWVLREASFERDTERVQAESIYLESMLSGSVNRFMAQLRQVSREPSVQATLLDSRGREQHIAQFMRLSMPAEGDATAEKAANLGMAVLDYRGRTLAQSGVIQAPEAVQEAVRDVLRTDQPQVRFDAPSSQLVMAFPLGFPGTGHTEGVVLGSFNLGTALDSLIARNGFRSSAKLHPVQPGPALRTGGALPEAQSSLKLLPPFASTSITLALQGSPERFRTEVRQLLLWHALGASVLLVALMLAAFYTARSVTWPIRALADTVAKRGDRDDAAPVITDSRAPLEVQQLGQAMNQAIQQIESGRAWLTLLERVMDSAHDGITVVDALAPDMPAIYVNRAVERITGYPAQELLGRNMRMLHQGESDQPELAAVRRALREGIPSTVVLRNRRKDGSLYMNELRLAPVRDSDGRLTHFIGIQNDVSERLSTQEQQAMSLKMEALGRLTGGLAHDFNNLLGIIIGNLDQTLAARSGSEASRERLQTALAAALRGADVTRAMLAVARRQPLERVAVDVNERLRELRPLIRNSVGARIVLEEGWCDGQAVAILDPNGFDSVILNLVINARDAMPDGGRLTIDTSIESVDEGRANDLEPGRYVCVRISDTGVGMASDVAARAFEPFFTTKPAGKGTGFGLSTAYGFTRQLGGGATLRTSLGKGTQVLLFLPQAPRNVVPPPPPSPAEVPASARAGLRLLVVDDEPHLRSLAAEWVGQLGYQVTTSPSADEARRLMEREAFDMLVTDIVMPGELDGLGLAMWAQERYPALRIMLATGYSERLGSGSLPWPLLDKPYRKADLARLLDAAVRTRATREALKS
jgi:PAS domain S-box-containing protein